MKLEKMEIQYNEDGSSQIISEGHEIIEIPNAYKLSIIGLLNKIPYINQYISLGLLEITLNYEKDRKSQRIRFQDEGELLFLNNIEEISFTSWNFSNNQESSFITFNPNEGKIITLSCDIIDNNLSVYIENIPNIQYIGGPVDNLYINGNHLSQCNIVSDNINRLSLRSISEIDHMEINKTIIQNFYCKTQKIKQLQIIETHILGGEFSDVSIEKIILDKSVLSGIRFYNINFLLEEENFSFYRSIFEKNNYSNIKWPQYFSNHIKYHNNWLNKTITNKIDNKELQETYRMLKYEYDNIGNKTEANKFYAKEMEYYMKSLEESGNKKDCWIARLQKFVSDFGNDWFRAFSLYVIICIFAFIIARNYSLAFDPWNEQICNGISDCKGYFIKLLNPVPKIEEINDSFWYLIFSIIKALLVYQIAVALRRISQR